MNKIELIRKSIEDKKICNCDVSEDDEYYYFRYGYPNKWDRQIPKEFIELLPISDPLEEQPDKGWIPVKDRLPEPEIDVMMLTKSGEIVIGSMDEDKCWWLKYTQTNKPTHWQKLPSAPVKQG